MRGTYHVCGWVDGGEVGDEGVAFVGGESVTYHFETDVEGFGFVVLSLRCAGGSFGGVDVGGLEFGAGGFEVNVFFCHVVVDDAATVAAGETGAGVVLRIDHEAAKASVVVPRTEGLVLVSAATEWLSTVVNDCEDVDGFYAVGGDGHGGDDDLIEAECGDE